MDEKMQLKRMIYARQFALLEIGLHLDTQPHDTAALKLRAQWTKELEALKQKYETRYGKLILTQSDVPEDQWCWINDPWPWDCQKEA